MKLLKQALVGAAVAAAFSAPAQASTVAISDLFINSLGFGSFTTPGDPTTFVNFTGALSVFNENRTGAAGASYNGIGGTGSGPNSISSPGAVVVDVGYRCAGDCTGALALYGGVMENNTTTHIGTPGTVNFAMGDMKIGGTALGGTIEGLTRANAMTAGATNDGGGNATILNSGQISGSFATAATFTGNISVGADYWLQAFVDSVLPVSGQASAGFGWNMSVTCSTNCGAGWMNLNFAPGELNQSLSSFGSGDNQTLADSSYIAFSDARTYQANTRYNFTINQSSNALVNERVSQVPEPASLALLGIGLVGMAAARRRKQAK